MREYLSPLLFNFALEPLIIKIVLELTEGFANQGSKLVLTFANDLETLASTRDVLEVFSQLKEKAPKWLGNSST